MTNLTCCVPGCRADTRKKKRLDRYPWMKGLKMHRFPSPRSKGSKREHWIRAVGMGRPQGWAPTRNSRVCSLHFSSGAFSKDNPVPDVFPWTIPKTESETDQIEEMEEKPNTEFLEVNPEVEIFEPIPQKEETGSEIDRAESKELEERHNLDVIEWVKPTVIEPLNNGTEIGTPLLQGNKLVSILKPLSQIRKEMYTNLVITPHNPDEHGCKTGEAFGLKSTDCSLQIAQIIGSSEVQNSLDGAQHEGDLQANDIPELTEEEKASKMVSEHLLHHEGLAFEDCSICKEWFDFVSINDNRGLEGKNCLICGDAFIYDVFCLGEQVAFENHMIKHIVDSNDIYFFEELSDEVPEVKDSEKKLWLSHKTAVRLKTYLGSNILVQPNNASGEEDEEQKINHEPESSNIKSVHPDSETVFVCHICGQVLHNQLDLTSHQKYHKKADHKCNHCSNRFKNFKDLSVHMQRHKEFQKVTEEINLVMSNLEGQVKHANQLGTFENTDLSEMPPNVIKCRTCGVTVQSLSQMKEHMKIHIKESLFGSQIQEFVEVPKEENLELIYKPIELEKEHSCANCKKTFKKIIELMEHMSKPCEEDGYKCKECGEILTFKKEFKEHMLIHGYDKKYVCATCNRRFRTPGELRQHEYMHDTVRRFECKICKKTYKRPNELYNHSQTHSGLSFPCDKCKRSFNSRAQVMKHMHDCQKEKLFKCHICGKNLTSRMNLKRHCLTHFKEKTFGCKICGKLFRQKTTVRTHTLLVHKDYHEKVKQKQLTIQTENK